jgi:antirestriction protein ArdC
MTKLDKPKFDVYQSVTDRIIAELEQGIVPWVKPWKSENLKGFNIGLPMNAKSKRHYNGINILLLWIAMMANGYASQYWTTYKGAIALGGNVRKGEKSTVIVYYDRFTPKLINGQPNDEEEAIWYMKTYLVWNLDQCDGIEGFEPSKPLPARELIENAEEVIAKTKAIIRHGGDSAYYSPTLDYIQMPVQQSFKPQKAYYPVMFHELGHWTGHSSRLDRKFTNKFGDENYAYEELIAELTSAFTCAAIGLEPVTRHVDYIGHWLHKLRDDKKYIIHAASAASKASDWILGDSAESIDQLEEAA